MQIPQCLQKLLQSKLQEVAISSPDEGVTFATPETDFPILLNSTILDRTGAFIIYHLCMNVGHHNLCRANRNEDLEPSHPRAHLRLPLFIYLIYLAPTSYAAPLCIVYSHQSSPSSLQWNA